MHPDAFIRPSGHQRPLPTRGVCILSPKPSATCCLHRCCVCFPPRRWWSCSLFVLVAVYCSVLRTHSDSLNHRDCLVMMIWGSYKECFYIRSSVCFLWTCVTISIRFLPRVELLDKVRHTSFHRFYLFPRWLDPTPAPQTGNHAYISMAELIQALNGGMPIFWVFFGSEWLYLVVGFNSRSSRNEEIVGKLTVGSGKKLALRSAQHLWLGVWKKEERNLN